MSSRLRTPLVCQMTLGLIFPPASFIIGIVLLARSGNTKRGRGAVIMTGAMALFWMPIFSTIMAAISLGLVE